jgi:hypothetical protein
MATLTLNNVFPYSPLRGSSQVRRRLRSQFEQVIPSTEPAFDFASSDYLLDSLSEITRQQSLSEEQIAKGRAKQRDERISIALKSFSITSFDEMKRFIEKHAYLIPLIEEIPSKIFEYFKQGESLSLEIVADPDFPQSSELWISVVTNASASEARPIMNQFDIGWWFENLDRAQCKLNITLDYV